jgi:CMP/dCMP kinase
MDRKIIITIARQYGSGGRYIGRLLAEKLNCPFYDKDLLTLAAEESGIDKDLFESADEKPSNRFWSSFAINAGSLANRPTPLGDIPINDKLFLIQSDIIKKVAAQGSCVIVGRCADHILKDDPDAVHVFIHSTVQEKLKRIVAFYNIPMEKAKESMLRTDKARASYYNYYVDSKWGQADNYHLSIDSSVLDIEGTAEMILTFALMKAGVR